MHVSASNGGSTGRVTTTGGLIALSLYWFPVNLFWTVMLQTFLPGRVEEMVGDASKGTYLLYISALGAVATTFVQLVIGPISDASANKMGRRHPFLLWGTLIAAGFILWFARAQNFAALMAAFFGLQLFLNAATGPYQALMPDNVPPARHGVASAYMGISLLVGQLIGAMTLFGMAFAKHKPSMFVVLLVVVALLVGGMLLTLVLVPDAPAPPEDRKDALTALATLKSLGFRKHKDFFGLLYSRFLINLSYSTVTLYLLYYLQDAIGPKDKAHLNQGIIIFIATIAGLVGTLIAGKFADKVPKKKLVYLSCAVLGGAALFFAFLNSLPAVFVLAFVFGAGWGAFSAVDWALAVNLLPQGGGAARYMAVWHACMTLPQVVAPFFGPVADLLNASYGHGAGWRAAMLSTVIYLISGALLLRRVRERSVAELERAYSEDSSEDSSEGPLATPAR